MPIYEYECVSCGERREDLRSMALRDTSTKCNKCGNTCERIFSRFNSLDRFNQINPAQRNEIGETNPAAMNRGPTAICGEGNFTVESCSFENFPTGISIAQGSNVKMRNNKFENVARPVVVR